MIDVDSDKAGAKQLLKRSKTEPVSCALALGEDGKSAVMVLDKLKAPRALLAQLQKDHPKISKPLFGTAEVDEDRDPKLIRLHVNKAVGGFARRLVKTLKGTGYNKVELLLEDGSVAESAGSEEEGEQAEQQGEQQAEAAQAAPKHDAEQLTRALKALVGRAASLPDQGVRSTLLKVANVAQGQIKANDLAGAEKSVIALNQALASAAKAGGGAPAAKLRPLWQDAKETVDGKLEQLARALRALDDEDANQAAEFGLFGLTSGGETVRLMKALTEYDGADGGKRADAAAAVRQAVAAYQSSLQASPVAEMLDTNPFGVDVGLRATLGGALSRIESALA